MDELLNIFHLQQDVHEFIINSLSMLHYNQKLCHNLFMICYNKVKLCDDFFVPILSKLKNIDDPFNTCLSNVVTPSKKDGTISGEGDDGKIVCTSNP
jgi:hypothetical protein